jgi:aspartate aminotransferase
MRLEFDKRRVYMYDRISKMPHVSCFKPHGAFYTFLDCEAVCKQSYKGELIGTAANIAKILLDDFDIAVIPCEDFGIKHHIRLSYAISMEQITKGLDRLETFLNTL